MKKISKFTYLSLLICFIFNSANILAQVNVIGSGMSGNPSVFFKGISGSQSFTTEIGSDLKNCGWFDLTAQNTAQYIIDGTFDDSNLQIFVRDTDGSVKISFKMPATQEQANAISQKAVDFILKKFFEIPGLCSSKIAFSGETRAGVKEIFYCDFDGTNVSRTTVNNTLSVESEWFPGKLSIIYTMYSKMHTYIIEYNLPSKRSRRLCQFPGLNSCANISPNGKTMAIILSIDGQVELYIKDVNSKAMRRLTTGKSVEASPCWSPDGNSLCYVSDSSGRPNLYIIGAGGGNPRKLQTLGSESVTPSWSYNNKIAYSSKMGKNYTIAILDLSGKEPQKTIINAAGDWENPSWAPDGRQIICSRTQGGRSSLYVVDTQTGKMRQLFNSSMNLSFPAWSGIVGK